MRSTVVWPYKFITVTAKKCDETWQIDTMHMKGDTVEYMGNEYKYILTVTDVLSQKNYLRAMLRKTSLWAAKALHIV